MKYILLVSSIMLSLNLFATCEQTFKITTEKDKVIILCEQDDLQITQGCAENVKKCPLLQDLKTKDVPKKVLESSIIGNPGSRICNSLGWKVHMGELFDESQVCTCLHPGGEYISCTSLSDYYQEKAKAKK